MISYSNNTNVGTATAKVTGKGNYKGEKSTTFTISKANMTVISSDYEGEPNGSSHTITLSVTKPTSNYQIYYSTTTQLTASNYTSGSTTKPTRKDSGTTLVYWYIHSTDGNYNDKSGSNKITVINQIENAIEKGTTFTEKTTLKDSSGKSVIIPKGFKIASDSADLVADGIVIEDTTTNKNQFVWVPVDDITNFVRIAGYSSGSQQSLTDFTEPYANGYTTETSEYNAMKTSVQNNHGFYIGRFESGKDSSGNVVVKKGATVYDYVPWGNAMNDISQGAVKLSKEFATNNNYQGVTSTLCYSVQWDAALKFIDPEFTGFAKNSTKQGWYSNNHSSIQTGNTEMNPHHTTGKDLIYSDNLNVIANKQKNIYDMAGNVYEWTMEVRYTYYRVLRGGSYNNGGSICPASIRHNGDPDLTDYGFGFRVALYL